ncbi:MAG: outer membrane protein assembly factor [Bacteroidales bacterium]|nr:outer membrane protein assembly factor [Bacteroidales bacterium]
MKKHLFISIIWIIISFAAIAQKDTAEIKKGWNIGILPVISYDSDLGLKYGGLTNIYDYGDGSLYPGYKHSVYLEVSRTTKGSGINQLFYDSKNLFPGKDIRVTADLSYLTEKALNFYGFNGYQSVYNPDWEDREHEDYHSRMFYRLERKIFRTFLDFQVPLRGNFRWLLGVGHFNIKVGEVDIDNLNEGRDPEDLLPDTFSLFTRYKERNWIDAKESDGGIVNYFKTGVIYDSRDNEPNPMSGMFSEILFMTAPRFLGNNEHPYTKIALTHRQYFTLVPQKLSFVYRINYQSTISGKAPFYMEPYMIMSFSPNVSNEALGGAKTLRGILRQRLTGEGYIFGNFETRWKLYKFKLIKQNFYLALSGFFDTGRITDFRETAAPASSKYLSGDQEEFHHSLGVGFHAAMNENFILAVDFGKALDKRDGNSGIYVGMNWLF